MNPETTRLILQRQCGEVIAQYPLASGEYSVGRSSENSIQAESDYVSRRHAKLTVTSEQLLVEDIGSSHGTYINGTAIQGPTIFEVNQAILLGDLFLTIQNQSEQVGTPRLHIPGDMIGGGRYTLKQELGRGGGGVVWSAQDEHLQQSVAVKRLPPELANDPIALNDLIGEVQKARLLSHPHIIRIHDYVKLTDELPFVTMEFVDGSDLGSLRNQQKDGRFSWERLEGLIVQMCEALQYAHEQQIIHRDLKPANIMITRDGNLKLADFGIAASVSDKSSQVLIKGDSSGTMVYMSPQQMRGIIPHQTDDIYALGATLYDLLTTRPPFYTGDIYQQVQEASPEKLSQRLLDFGLTNDVPSHVEAAIMQCLAKESEKRPDSAKELAKLFHPGAEPPPSPPPPPEVIPEMESVLAEPLEQTQKFLENNLPPTFTTWWRRQNVKKRDLTLVGCIIFGLICAELVFSKFKHGEFFHTLRHSPHFIVHFRPVNLPD